MQLGHCCSPQLAAATGQACSCVGDGWIGYCVGNSGVQAFFLDITRYLQGGLKRYSLLFVDPGVGVEGSIVVFSMGGTDECPEK